MPEAATLHDQLTAAFTGALTEMWQPTVGHSCTGDLPALADDARVLAKVAEVILRQRVQALEDALSHATHFLVGPYRVAQRTPRHPWEVWPDPALISLTTLDPPEQFDDRDSALARARQLAEL
jgi:hypothetical protein